MAAEIFVFAACLAAAQAGVVPASPVLYSQVQEAPLPLHYAPAQAVHAVQAVPVAPVYAKAIAVEDFDPNPQYKFSYDVKDELTGDSKSQHESRSGDVVHGSYSLNDPDGTRRTVDYTSDPVNGFNAVVRKEPQLVKVAPVLPVAKVIAPAPVVYAQPAPVVHQAEHVPVAYAAAPLSYASPPVYHH